MLHNIPKYGITFSLHYTWLEGRENKTKLYHIIYLDDNNILEKLSCELFTYRKVCKEWGHYTTSEAYIQIHVPQINREENVDFFCISTRNIISNIDIESCFSIFSSRYCRKRVLKAVIKLNCIFIWIEFVRK